MDWPDEFEMSDDQSGFGSSVGLGERPALVVIDLINAFTDPETELGSDVGGVLEQTERLLAAFRENDLPRYFTTVAFEESYGDAGRFIEKVPALRELQLGTEAVEVDDSVAPAGDERVILKKYASAFFGTDLETELTTNRVDTLVLAGVTTSGCVRATAVDSLQHGYRTIVPADAVGDRAEGPHRANLFDIDQKYGDVVETDDVLAELE
ncbi:isochorismatase family protein (plasmid) [Natronomonas pharaonis DSM 2160]|uniref:Isochorismatase family protein n=1 Tax=Natronomonas pharaonis (strain ATCC 35678 / DSM 2160 / CIP 103997 / JCM 8858 / NBRC 14720 / NCIMB 2260 / Gabara) TaxID=348780 RepID=Q3ILY2_NATPD|nr:isochorismatase family protein [Natronomonas pharaonis]CAI50887.1 isochorismatase family protein [Natronomonas pharaonis DSM 2160]